MSAVTRPRGPLPSRVYWTRRAVLLLVVLALVLGVSRVLGSGGAPGPAARAVGAEASRSPAGSTAGSPASSPSGSPTPTLAPTPATTPASSPASSPTSSATGGAGRRSASPAAPAQPSGACDNRDVVVTPRVTGKAHAAQPVVFKMRLRTRTSAPCSWTVSPDTLVVKVSSGSDDVWSTQQCRGPIPKQSVVLSKDVPTVVRVAWSTQRSDAECSRSPSWAKPGFYHVMAAALGSDPADHQFRLLKPRVDTVVKPPKLTKKERRQRRAEREAKAKAKAKAKVRHPKQQG